MNYEVDFTINIQQWVDGEMEYHCQAVREDPLSRKFPKPMRGLQWSERGCSELPSGCGMSAVDKGGKKRKKKGKFKKNSKHGLLSKEDLDFIVDKTKYTSEEVEEWHRSLNPFNHLIFLTSSSLHPF